MTATDHNKFPRGRWASVESSPVAVPVLPEPVQGAAQDNLATVIEGGAVDSPKATCECAPNDLSRSSPFVSTVKIIGFGKDFIEAGDKIRDLIKPVFSLWGFTSLPREVSLESFLDIHWLKCQVEQEEEPVKAGRTYNVTDFPALDAYEKAFAEIGEPKAVEAAERKRVLMRIHATFGAIRERATAINDSEIVRYCNDVLDDAYFLEKELK